MVLEIANVLSSDCGLLQNSKSLTCISDIVVQIIRFNNVMTVFLYVAVLTHVVMFYNNQSIFSLSLPDDELQLKNAKLVPYQIKDYENVMFHYSVLLCGIYICTPFNT